MVGKAVNKYGRMSESQIIHEQDEIKNNFVLKLIKDYEDPNKMIQYILTK